MARIAWVHERLLVWARWRIGAGGGVGCRSAIARLVEVAGSGGYREAVIPKMEVESSELDDVIDTLVEEQREAVYLTYVATGPIERRAVVAGCSVRTLQLRVELAHFVIAEQLQARRERADAVQAQRRKVTTQASDALDARWRASEDTGHGYASWVKARKQAAEDDGG